MAIYKEGKRLVKLWKGAEKIARVYKGSELIFGYPPETLLFEQSTAGTYSLTLDYDVKCHIEIVGGGGGGFVNPAHDLFYGGGSGAYIKGEAIIPAGTYEIIVGAGGNYGYSGSVSSFLGQEASGGITPGSGGQGGTATVTLPELTGINGNSGALGHAGASVYDGQGTYGAGGFGLSGGTGGYVKIQTV
jgi:hypothetical protein